MARIRSESLHRYLLKKMTNIFELAYVDPEDSGHSVNCKVHVTVDKKNRAFNYWFSTMNIVTFLFPNKNYKNVVRKYIRPEFQCQYKFLRARAINVSFWTGHYCTEWRDDTMFLNLVAVEMLAMLSERKDRNSSLYRLFPFMMPIECDLNKNLRFVHWIRNTLIPCINIDMAKLQCNESLSKYPYLSASIALRNIEEVQQQQQRYIAPTPSAPPLPEDEQEQPDQTSDPSPSPSLAPATTPATAPVTEPSPSSTSQKTKKITTQIEISPYKSDVVCKAPRSNEKQIMDIVSTIFYGRGVCEHEPENEYVIFKTKYSKNENPKYRI